MTDPKYVQDKMGGSGGSGGTHMYSYIADLLALDTREAKLAALLIYTEELTAYASSIRDSFPEQYKSLRATIGQCVENLQAFKA